MNYEMPLFISEEIVIQLHTMLMPKYHEFELYHEYE